MSDENQEPLENLEPQPSEIQENSVPHKKVGRKKGQVSDYNPMKDNRTFRDILSEMNDQGMYINVHPVEFRKGIKPGGGHKFERNWLKNQALSLMAHGGFSPAQVAYMLQVAPSTISTWRANATPETLAKIEVAELREVTKRIAQAVNTSLGAVESIALYVSEREYIQKQDPEKVSRIFEMLTSFATKLIEAKQRMEMSKRQIAQDEGYAFTDETQNVKAKDETKAGIS